MSPAENYKSKALWPDTVKLLDRLCKKIAKEKGLPRGRKCPATEALHIAVSEALEARQ